MTEIEQEMEAIKSSKVFKNIFIDKEEKSYGFEPFDSGQYVQITIDETPIFPSKSLMIWNPVEHKINIGEISNLVIDYESIDEGFIILWSGTEYKKLKIKKAINI